MRPRSYVSPVRDAAAAAKRDRVIAAAARVLNGKKGIESFSIERVAKAAGVTRLTIYNQFGSRTELLEAVFDELARQRGLGRIADAMRMADPLAGLDRLIEIFCEFWDANQAVGRLHAATGADSELAKAIADRNERRRRAINVLVGRIQQREEEERIVRKDAVDLLFALTSYATFEMLRSGRSREDVQAVMRSACHRCLFARDATQPE